MRGLPLGWETLSAGRPATRGLRCAHVLLLRVHPPTSLRQVFDIGAGCDEPARKVAELPDYLQEVTRLSGGRQQVFGAGDDKRSTAIKYLAVVRE